MKGSERGRNIKVISFHCLQTHGAAPS